MREDREGPQADESETGETKDLSPRQHLDIVDAGAGEGDSDTVELSINITVDSSDHQEDLPSVEENSAIELTSRWVFVSLQRFLFRTEFD